MARGDVMADRRKPVNGVGVLFWAKDTGRSLYLLRGDREGSWCLPGGKVERGETLRGALQRECREEIDWWPEDAKLYPVECYTSNDGRFLYHTFFCAIDREFIPVLNDEHVAYAWCVDGAYPRPLHSGLYNTLMYDTVKQKIEIIRDNLK